MIKGSDYYRIEKAIRYLRVCLLNHGWKPAQYSDFSTLVCG